MRIRAAKNATTPGTFLGGLVSRPRNGITKTNVTTAAEIGPNGSAKRRMKYGCSQGSIPYQMTMYCDQFRYIQNTEKAKTSFPRSWYCLVVMNGTSPILGRSSVTAMAVIATPPWNAAQKKATG